MCDRKGNSLISEPPSRLGSRAKLKHQVSQVATSEVSMAAF